MRMDEWIIETQGDTSSRARLAKMLNQAFAGLVDMEGNGPWMLQGNGTRIYCRMAIEKGRKDFCEKSGMVLAEFAISEKEPMLLRRSLQRKFGVRDAVESDVLISEAICLLDGEPEIGSEEDPFAVGRGRRRRIRKMGLQIGTFMAGSSRLHLDGFLRFRMREYEADLCEAVETAVEDRMMERQYQEFMSLLQNMVEWQEVRIPTVHVMHAAGKMVELLDERMQPLPQEEELRTGIVADVDTPLDEQEEESMLVSRLLAASPGHLFIHTAEPEAQVIRTLMGIYGERAAICETTYAAQDTLLDEGDRQQV